MSFLAGIAPALLGYFGQQQANAQTANAQSAAQQQAQQYAQGQTQQAKAFSGQALQQALQNLGQYQQQNPAPINQLGAIQGPGAAQGQPQQSFGGGQVGGPTQGMVPGMPPGGGMRPPGQPQAQMPQQNLQGAMQQQPQGQPQAQQFQRLQQLYPLMQQMLAAGNRSQAMPMARSAGGVL